MRWDDLDHEIRVNANEKVAKAYRELSGTKPFGDRDPNDDIFYWRLYRLHRAENKNYGKSDSDNGTSGIQLVGFDLADILQLRVHLV